MGEAAIAIRIQLGAMPPMLGDIVVQMLGNDGASEDGATEIVGQSGSDADIVADARRANADLLVVRASGRASGRASESGHGPVAHIRSAIGLDILEIAEDAHHATLLRVGSEPVTLDRETLGALALRLRGRA